jgi:LacI family transcriptional regulator
MGKRVTIQDIADRLGLSRNTVSKALNNVAGLSDSTRELILKTAMEMGYKQFAFIGAVQDLKPKATTAQAVRGPNEIALLTTAFIDRSHFASLTLDALHFELSQRGYVLNTHRVNRDQLAAHELPITLRLENTTAILCIEMFDRNYCNFICSLGVPTLFFDGPPRVHGFNLESDQILMDNTTSVMRLVVDMARRGVKRIGFVGDWEHCRSFFERYTAFRSAMVLAHESVDERFCIEQNKEARIFSELSKLDELPELFICANDFVAFDTLRALRHLGLDVPRDILLSGFDDSAESRNWMPPLTTVHIHTQSMAFSAMEILMTRMQEPSLEYRMVYAQTDLICRRSTERD